MSKKQSLKSGINTKQSQQSFQYYSKKSYPFMSKVPVFSNKKIIPMNEDDHIKQVQKGATFTNQLRRHRKVYSNTKLQAEKIKHNKTEIMRNKQSELIINQIQNHPELNKTEDKIASQKQITLQNSLFLNQSIQQQPIEAIQSGQYQNTTQQNKNKNKIISGIKQQSSKQQQKLQKREVQDISPIQFRLVNSFVCQICCERYSSKYETKLPCFHSFCQYCMLKYAQLLIMQDESIRCPYPKCRQNINNLHFLQNLPSPIYRRYQKYRHFLENIKKDGVIICPNQKCDDGLLHINNSTMISQQHQLGIRQNITKITKLQCNKCSIQYCNRCLKQMSGDGQLHRQCRQWKQVQQQIQDNYDFKRCKRCKRLVQKSKGCNHMTCKCGNQFCYKCGQNWKFLHLCNPFLYKKLSSRIKKSNQSHFQNAINSIQQIGNQQPQTSEYVFYVLTMIAFGFWSLFAFVFCILPVIIFIVMAFFLYLIALLLLGLTYGYVIVLCQILDRSDKILVKLVYIMLPILPMTKGTILIYNQYFNKLQYLIILFVKLVQIVIPFQIITTDYIH